MIGLLRGRLVEREASGAIILDVGGVGYELQVPLGSLGRVAQGDDDVITLHVHTNVREDALELFGFASRGERATFRTLIGISKVGPKLALSVLSALSPEELASAVATSQVTRLTKISGVGKKTAERMVLELKGKLIGVTSGTRGATPVAVVRDEGPRAAVVSALVGMGFKLAEAERAAAQLGALDRPVSDLLREALAVLTP